MTSVGTVVSYPTPLYSNVPIHAEYYQPSRFVISGVTRGATTVITTSVANNYVIGQQVRLLFPRLYGCFQLNGLSGYVISLPSTTQVQVAINSSLVDAFVPSPITATITGVTKANPCVVTAANSFRVGNTLTFASVGGMTQLTGNFKVNSCNSTTITLNVDSTSFTTYTSGGTATLEAQDLNVPQIMAIGDINSGCINTSGNVNQSTYIPGAFTDISPN